MTVYSLTSEQGYTLRHNAQRAARKVEGAVVFQCEADSLWYWGVPAEQPEQEAAEATALGFVQEVSRSADAVTAKIQFSDPAVGAALEAEPVAEDDGLSRAERCGVDEDAVYFGGEDEPDEDWVRQEAEQLEADARQAERLAAEDAEFRARDREPDPDPAAELSLPPPDEPVRSLREIAEDMAEFFRAGTPVHSGNLLAQEMLAALARPARRRAQAEVMRQPRRARPERDWTVKPVITSRTNQHVQKLIDKIDAARGDAEALRALNTFRRSNTYSQMAGRFLDALLAQAEG